MAFATGTSTNLDNLIDQMMTFAVANAGYTDVTGGFHRVLEKDGMHYHFATTTHITVTQVLRMALSQTYANEDWAATPSISAQASMTAYDFVGPYSGHYFFSDGGSVHCVLEVSPGIFNHLSFGAINKHGDNWVGGEFIAGGHYHYKVSNLWRPISDVQGCCTFTATGSNSSPYRSQIRVEGLPNATSIYAPFGSATLSNRAYGCSPDDTLNIQENILRDSPNAATGRVALLPQYIHVHEDAGDLHYHLGTIDGVRILKMDNIQPAEIVNTDWQVFPICQKNGDRVNCPDSGTYAFAYKRA